MTPDSTLFSTKHHDSYTPLIQTVDGSPMTVTYTGTISKLNTTLPNTYYIPKLTFNLIYVGHFCEFGLIMCRIQRRDILLG
jgi:hypothetical protein